MKTKVKISKSIRIRKEFFGGLVFRKSDFAIFEINDKTLELFELIKESNSLEIAYSHFKKKYNLDKETYDSLTNLLFQQKIIYNE